MYYFSGAMLKHQKAAQGVDNRNVQSNFTSEILSWTESKQIIKTIKYIHSLEFINKAFVDLFDNIIMSPITNKTTFVFEWKDGGWPR